MKKNKLTVKCITVRHGQRLSQVSELYPLPNNSIIYKTMTGLGATYSEINSDRHSFIIEPNVPVIQSKVEEHNAKVENKDRQILGVHKGIYKDDILAYLMSDAKFKKILSTPEGFIDKIIPAIKDNIDFYKNYFYLLIDECEKNIQDSSYRGKINAPFDVFFDFVSKGMISATPLEFSDPRFAEHGFIHYVIEPDYDFSQPLELIHTNNVLEAFTDYLKDNIAEQYCIFVNSTNAIAALISQLKIKNESAVFCADESVTKLDLKELPIARSDFKNKHMRKYNFFTSRYFSAFDMKLENKPNVVMITDVYFAKHSILDPATEVIQIAGRLRNGIAKLTHITNFNPDLKSMDEDEAITYLDGIRDMFKSILLLAKNMPHKGQQDFLDQISKVELAKFFKLNGDTDWFMYDNFINEERVKKYYQKLSHLVDAYELIKSHFTLSLKDSYYLLGDEDKLKRETADSHRAFLMELASQVDKIEKSVYFLIDKPREIRLLRNINETVVDGYYTIGLEGLRRANYVESKIKKATEIKRQTILLSATTTIDHVYRYLFPNSRYSDDKIKKVLGAIYNRVGIKKKPSASDIKLFFYAKRTTVDGGKGFVTTNRRYDFKSKN